MPGQNLIEDVRAYIASLPIWQKIIATKILEGRPIDEDDISLSCDNLLGELGVKEVAPIPVPTVPQSTGAPMLFSPDLRLTKMTEVKGVNALVGDQVVEFSPMLTVIYGTNGSGKTGYVRLLKKAFSSKTAEEILPDIYSELPPESPFARFHFATPSSTEELTYPDGIGNAQFKQFSIFDGKSALLHLTGKNEFDFQPFGLAFFNLLIAEIKKVEQRFNAEVEKNKQGADLSEILSLLDGSSVIKDFVSSISYSTPPAMPNAFFPYSQSDIEEKADAQRKKNDLLLIRLNSEREETERGQIATLLGKLKDRLIRVNEIFCEDHTRKLNESIAEWVAYKAVAEKANKKAIESNGLAGIGSDEWKAFVRTGLAFAKRQHDSEATYPKDGDICIFCHQSLDESAITVIQSYKEVFSGIAEQNFSDASQRLEQLRQELANLDLVFLRDDDVLTKWLATKCKELVDSLRAFSSDADSSRNKALECIATASMVDHIPSSFDTSLVESAIAILSDEAARSSTDLIEAEIATLDKTLTYLVHKELFSTHIDRIKRARDCMAWIKTASGLSWSIVKRDITEAQKGISEQYYNTKYVEYFNRECGLLNANLGVEIGYTGASAVSFRQLTIKNKSPLSILSEGEQKVIALADYFAEMELSEMNCGMIFDDPVNSLDEYRKKVIARRLCYLTEKKQVVVFTHDLVFLSMLVQRCEEDGKPFDCHWVEKRESKAGYVALRNAPSYEREYRNADKPKELLRRASIAECQPQDREWIIRSAFTQLRTCYEVLVIHELFGDVVQRYNERVSVEALGSVHFTPEIRDQVSSAFGSCCRFMEGHSHSDQFAYVKPGVENLKEEIDRFERLRSIIRKAKSTAGAAH